jgi:hypothetical protein
MMQYSYLSDLIDDVMKHASEKVRSYCGGMFVGMLYNVQGNEIIVNWAHGKTGASEIYSFHIGIDSEQFYERVNNGENFDQYASNLVEKIYHHMVLVESQQMGRPPAFQVPGYYS